jgi:2-hydroxy-6-oxonona-2,4-dienedioate hydrolase
LESLSHQSAWEDLHGVTFRQRWVAAGAVRTRLLETGEGHPRALVFLHGTGGHAEAYTRNLGPHGRSFHTYAIDLVGHGWSDKPLGCGYEYPDYVAHLRAFLDAEGIDRVYLSGESMGGGVAAWFALSYPSRVVRLVLNTGVAPLYDESAVTRLAALTRAAAQSPSWESVRKRLEFLMYRPESVTGDLVSARLAILRQPGMAEVTERILQRLVDPELRRRNALYEQQWRQIEVPTLVLWTDHDPMAPATTGRRVARWLPNGRFVLMKECGHWPQFEDADAFNALHLAFLEQ